MGGIRPTRAWLNSATDGEHGGDGIGESVMHLTLWGSKTVSYVVMRTSRL